MRLSSYLLTVFTITNLALGKKPPEPPANPHLHRYNSYVPFFVLNLKNIELYRNDNYRI